MLLNNEFYGPSSTIVCLDYLHEMNTVDTFTHSAAEESCLYVANTACFHHHELDTKFSADSNILFDQCAHTHKHTIALVWLQVFMLFILN